MEAGVVNVEGEQAALAKAETCWSGGGAVVSVGRGVVDAAAWPAVSAKVGWPRPGGAQALCGRLERECPAMVAT